MTQVHLSAPDYLVVVGYFVIVLLDRLLLPEPAARRRSDYFAGGNQIPWWLAGISHYMSSFSAFAFIAYAQMGYTYGWVAVTLFWATIPGVRAGRAVLRPALAARPRDHPGAVSGKPLQWLRPAACSPGRASP